MAHVQHPREIAFQERSVYPGGDALNTPNVRQSDGQLMDNGSLANLQMSLLGKTLPSHYQDTTGPYDGVAKENSILPDAWIGKINNFVARVVMRKLADIDRYLVTDVLPMEGYDGGPQFTIKTVAFPDARTVPVPHLGTAPAVTKKRSSRTVGIERHGLSILMEDGYRCTPQGVSDYHHHLEQVRVAVQQELCASAMTALLDCHDDTNEKLQKVFLPDGEDISPHEFFAAALSTVGCLAKRPHGFQYLRSVAVDSMSSMAHGHIPDTLLMPVGIAELYVMNHDEVNMYYKAGPAGPKALRNPAGHFNSVSKNMQIRSVGKFPVENSPIMQDPLRSLRMFGDKYFLTLQHLDVKTAGAPFNSQVATITVMDYRADQLKTISMLDCIRQSGLFESEDDGATMGNTPFGAALIQMYGTVDNWCEAYNVRSFLAAAPPPDAAPRVVPLPDDVQVHPLAAPAFLHLNHENPAGGDDGDDGDAPAGGDDGDDGDAKEEAEEDDYENAAAWHQAIHGIFGDVGLTKDDFLKLASKAVDNVANGNTPDKMEIDCPHLHTALPNFAHSLALGLCKAAIGGDDRYKDNVDDLGNAVRNRWTQWVPLFHAWERLFKRDSNSDECRNFVRYAHRAHTAAAYDRFYKFATSDAPDAIPAAPDVPVDLADLTFGDIKEAWKSNKPLPFRFFLFRNTVWDMGSVIALKRGADLGRTLVGFPVCREGLDAATGQLLLTIASYGGSVIVDPSRCRVFPNVVFHRLSSGGTLKAERPTNDAQYTSLNDGCMMIVPAMHFDVMDQTFMDSTGFFWESVQESGQDVDEHYAMASVAKRVYALRHPEEYMPWKNMDSMRDENTLFVQATQWHAGMNGAGGLVSRSFLSTGIHSYVGPTVYDGLVGDLCSHGVRHNKMDAAAYNIMPSCQVSAAEWIGAR